MTLKREIKNAYIENGHPVYVKTHSDAVYVDENETETLTQRLDDVKSSITEHTTQLNDMTNNVEQLSNPNLLINGNFQVWQRGTSFNGANIYTADRWKTNFNATVTKKNGKAHVYANELFGGLIQFIEFEDMKNSIQGRDISGTIKLNIISGYVTFVVQFIPKSSAPTITKSITVNNGVNSLTLTAPDNLDDYRTFECLVYGNPNTEYEIEYMKVELGSFATPFVPRLYEEELALCQRYYFRNKYSSLPARNIHVSGDKTYLETCEYRFPVQMRTTPTIRALITQPLQSIHTCDLSLNFYDSAINVVSPSEIGTLNNAMCCFRYEMTAGALQIANYICEIYDDAYEFDAETY